jgi:hypothetical protein
VLVWRPTGDAVHPHTAATGWFTAGALGGELPRAIAQGVVHGQQTTIPLGIERPFSVPQCTRPVS